MPATGITLTLKIGKEKPKPASRDLLESLQSVEVSHRDEGRSGFQIVFQAGRSGASERNDSQLLKDPLLKPANRVILIVTLNAKARVLMDGIITHQQFSPSFEPGGSTLTITGEDISVMMDLKQNPVEHPAQDAKQIVEQILEDYRQYGLVTEIAASPESAPSTQQQIPVKQGTDLGYIQLLAQRYAYVFYVTPGPDSGQNTVYWGPPKRPGQKNAQQALTLNMGPYTNLESINFQNSALAPTKVLGRVQDGKNNQIQLLNISDSKRPPLAKSPALKQDEKFVRTIQFRETGHTFREAQERAQAMTDRSVDEVVRVTGAVDTVRYGALLEIRKLVGLRGAGYSYDGLYYVKQVTHRIRPGEEYKQEFLLTREGLDTTVQQLSL